MNTTFLHQSVSTRNSLDGNSGMCFVAFTAFTNTLRFKFLTYQFALDCFLTCILKGNFYLYSYQSMAAAARPATPTVHCNPMHYPNIRVVLQLACTLPVTSCECERRSSTMHSLHIYIYIYAYKHDTGKTIVTGFTAYPL